ncbi:MAG TPA: hypothetical protein VK963_00890, partial [Candidatus Saccharimonadales bacterium]|nr:hypothetical protein [Candidatus Saccharimonadales bacterium]
KVTSTFTGFAWQRNHRKGVERLQARKAQYARAIRELYEGKTDFAAIQLQQMAREALNLDQRTSFWRRFGFDRPMYRLPTPLAPGVLYGPQVRSKTFIATVKLLRELS